ncbi:30S ribosomal protein S27e, partial [Candidatus Bathyarchaeota archaeon]|nr:30S ribosomal protein S27e [Candidatus Bathyarchaeota archaeon]
NKVNCNVCGAELAKPSGGKAIIKGEIIAIFE